MEDLLNKYWQGNATKEELIELYKLVADSDQSMKLQLAQQFRDEVEAGQPVQHVDFDLLQQQIRTKIGLAQPAPVVHIASARKRVMTGIAVAASVFIIFLSAYYYFSASPKTKLLAEQKEQSAGSPWISVSSKDHDSTFMLPDSSRLTLSPNSSIQYDTAYNLANRVIYLENGSLSVKVKKNKALPFSVIAEHTRTTALGTVFEVSKNKDGSIVVHLLEGVVNVKQRLDGNRLATYLLHPGERLWMNERENKLTKAPVSSGASGLVKAAGTPKPADRTIRFEQENLGAIIKKLESRFNISIRAEESVMKDNWFSGEFKETDSAVTILEMICIINKLQLIAISEKEFEIKVLKP